MLAAGRIRVDAIAIKPIRAIAVGLVAAALAGGVAPKVARAELTNPELVCAAPPDALSPTRLLRAISLDLRGYPPSLEELEAVETDPTVGDTLLDEWLLGDAFAERMVRMHQSLLWPNVSDTRLIAVRASLRQNGGIWWRGGTQASFYRGSNVICADTPAAFDEDGSIVQVEMDDGTRREGWVEVDAYWVAAEDNPIKVCALDAQDAIVSASGTACASNAGLNDMGCGCGPALRHCGPGSVNGEITRAMGEDIAQRVRQMVRDDASYVSLLTGSVGWFNGPLVHYWKYLRAYPRMRMTPAPVPVEVLPELPWDAYEHVPVELGENQSGVLTSPAYLLRFQTNRARANRYYSAFLCQPFNAPSGGIPISNAQAAAEPDIQIRQGCSYCHALLEPASAHWGRWGERGASWLDPAAYPALDETCLACATTGLSCSERCRVHYTVTASTPAESEYLGTLNAYLFRRDAHIPYVDQGPSYLVATTLVDGRLPRCMARTVAQQLLGRALGQDEEGWVDQLAQQFAASGYKLRTLFKAVLTHPAYRRVR